MRWQWRGALLAILQGSQGELRPKLLSHTELCSQKPRVAGEQNSWIPKSSEDFVRKGGNTAQV